MKHFILSLFSIWLGCSQVSLAYDLKTQYQKFVPYEVNTHFDFLSEEDKAVLNKLLQVSELMSEIYRRQLTPDYDVLQQQLLADDFPEKDITLKMFNLYFSPWDDLANDHIFYGNQPRLDGANFYPVDMSKQEFEQWLAQHPEDIATFTHPRTVIQRQDDQLVAIPYASHYQQWVQPAISLLEEAAKLTSNTSFANYLNQCALALASDDYYAADVAWIDVKDTVIEVVIGAYEIYADRLFGYKTAFQAFITVKNPQESEELAHFKSYLKTLEHNLPIDDAYKNLDKAFFSPIVVTNQLQGGGFVKAGIQNLAFNLPNDERVRKNKGSKNVLLKNVIEAKFYAILQPLAQRLLSEEYAKRVEFESMFYNILFHELSHALGPDALVIDGKPTTVARELKDLYSTIEEAKADVMGIYHALYMLEQQQLPEQTQYKLLTSYFMNFFRPMRFGLNDSHSRGSAIQYHYYLRHGAISYSTETQQFSIDYEKLVQSISSLLNKILMLQAKPDYATTAAFIKKNAQMDATLQAILDSLDTIPVDIRPLYPEKI